MLNVVRHHFLMRMFRLRMTLRNSVADFALSANLHAKPWPAVTLLYILFLLLHWIWVQNAYLASSILKSCILCIAVCGGSSKAYAMTAVLLLGAIAAIFV